MKSHQCNTDPVTAADVVIVLWRQHSFHRQQIPSVLKSSDSDCGDINSHNMLSGDNKIISSLVSHTTRSQWANDTKITSFFTEFTYGIYLIKVSILRKPVYLKLHFCLFSYFKIITFHFYSVSISA